MTIGGVVIGAVLGTVGIQRLDARQMPTAKPEAVGISSQRLERIGPLLRADIENADLIQKLLDAGRPVASFPIREYWLDIGQHSDYEKAQEHIKDWKSR